MLLMSFATETMAKHTFPPMSSPIGPEHSNIGLFLSVRRNSHGATTSPSGSGGAMDVFGEVGAMVPNRSQPPFQQTPLQFRVAQLLLR